MPSRIMPEIYKMKNFINKNLYYFYESPSRAIRLLCKKSAIETIKILWLQISDQKWVESRLRVDKL